MSATKTPDIYIGSDDYVAILEGIARRITTGAGVCYTDGLLLMQAAGALKYEQRALREERERNHRTQIAMIRGQPYSIDPTHEVWVRSLDDWATSPDGTAELEAMEARWEAEEMSHAAHEWDATVEF